MMRGPFWVTCSELFPQEKSFQASHLCCLPAACAVAEGGVNVSPSGHPSWGAGLGRLLEADQLHPDCSHRYQRLSGHKQCGVFLSVLEARGPRPGWLRGQALVQADSFVCPHCGEQRLLRFPVTSRRPLIPLKSPPPSWPR